MERDLDGVLGQEYAAEALQRGSVQGSREHWGDHGVPLYTEAEQRGERVGYVREADHGGTVFR